MQQLEAFAVPMGVRFTLQGNGFGSVARIEAHSELHPCALEEALEKGLLRGEWDRGRRRYRRHFANPLRAFNAAMHIQRLDEKWKPSLLSAPIETTIDVDRLCEEPFKLTEHRGKKMMREAMPFCAIPDCLEDDPDILEVHHIHGRGGSNPHRLTNLITLCRNHHRLADKGRLAYNLERLWVQVVDANHFPTEYR